MARKEGLIGRKVGMTQVFAEDGSQVPVTVIEAGPCTIIGIRTTESHGYDALQLGFGAKKKNVSKPAAGLFKKANVSPMRVVREVRLEKTEKLQGYQLGQALTVEMFAPGELVDVVGVSKGKGFQGGVKRHGWYGGDATNGSMFHRAPGSIGASSDPSRVWPGHHLPGRMGGDRRTVLNLSVVRVMADQNIVLVRDVKRINDNIVNAQIHRAKRLLHKRGGVIRSVDLDAVGLYWVEPDDRVKVKYAGRTEDHYVASIDFDLSGAEPARIRTRSLTVTDPGRSTW